MATAFLSVACLAGADLEVEAAFFGAGGFEDFEVTLRGDLLAAAGFDLRWTLRSFDSVLRNELLYLPNFTLRRVKNKSPSL
jgi:hypothetical protein